MTERTEEHPALRDLRLPADALVAALSAALATLCKDGPRTHMNYLFWRDHGDRVELVTTDGFRVTRAVLPRMEAPDSAPIAFGIRRPAVKAAITALKGARLRSDRVRLTFGGEHIAVRRVEGESTPVLIGIDRTLGAEFPPIDKVIPEPQAHPVGLNPKFALEAYRAAEMVAKTSPRKAFYAATRMANPLDPVRVDAETPDLRLTIVLMPVRL